MAKCDTIDVDKTDVPPTLILKEGTQNSLRITCVWVFTTWEQVIKTAVSNSLFTNDGNQF